MLTRTLRLLALAALGGVLAAAPAQAGGGGPLEKKKAAKKPAKPKTKTVSALISLDDCRRLIVDHIADPGVAYKPGRDVYGRRVAPAGDPRNQKVALPKVIRVTFAIRMEDYLGITVAPGQEAKARLGQLTVRGRDVYFNGQPLDDPHRSFIVKQCRQRLRAAGG